MNRGDNGIGKRAAAEIRARAYEEDTSFAAQLAVLKAPSSIFCRWEHGQGAPRAETRAKMSRAGYDVLYILTGERSQT